MVSTLYSRLDFDGTVAPTDLDRATGSDTDYSYNTTSGKLSYRDFPKVSRQNIRTTYGYDSAVGRIGISQ